MVVEVQSSKKRADVSACAMAQRARSRAMTSFMVLLSFESVEGGLKRTINKLE
jgi:hypothetical protein